MSLLTANGKLIADLWPAELPRMAKDISAQYNLTKRDIVPSTLKDLSQWAYITKDINVTDPSRRHLLVYITNCDDGELRPLQVAIRVQGFISKMNLKPTGNWSMTETDAPKASQYLILTSGDCEEAFTQQMEALNNVRQLILRHFNADDATTLYPTLHLKRRVFTKVKTGDAPRNALRSEDDPTGVAKRMARRWVVDQKLEIGRQEADKRLRKCSHIVLQRGDFVDATVTADIVCFPSSSGPRTQVHFKLHRVVQLLPRALIKPTLVRQPTPPVTALTAIPTHTGHAFDDDEEMSLVGLQLS